MGEYSKMDVFFEANPNPMWVYEPGSLKIKAVNKAATALYGYSKEEMLSMTIGDLRPESKFGRLQKEVSRRKKEFNDSGVWLHKKKNKEHLYVRVLSYPINWQGEECKLVVAHDVTRQKDIEQDYHVEQELLYVLVQNFPGIFYLFNREGKMVRWNRQLVKVTGYTDEEIEKKSPLDFFGEEDHTVISDAIENAFSEGYEEVQAELRTKKGKSLPYYFYTSRVDITGDPHLIGIGMDISSLKEARLKSERNRLLLSAIMNQSESAISVKDEEGRYQVVNSKYGELFGLDPDKIIGKRERELYADMPGRGMRKIEKEIFRDGDVTEVEEKVITSEGERTFVAVRYPLHDVPEYENSICSIATDITDLKIAQNKLQKLYKKEKKERRRIERINSHLKLLEKVGDIFAEEHSNYVAALGKVSQLLLREVADICTFDVFEEESLTRVVQEMDVAPEKRKIAQKIRRKYPGWFYDLEVYQEAVNRGKPILRSRFSEEELKKRVQNEELVRLIRELEVQSYFLLPLKVQDKVIGTLTLITLQGNQEIEGDDFSTLTELASKTALHIENSLINRELREFNKNLEEKVKERTRQLENANEELESFSYSVSHDLRTPLRAIGGYTSLLLEDYLEDLDEDGKNFLTIVNDEAKRMGELIDDLLSFSRLSRKEKVGQFFSMNTLVRQCIDEVLQSNPEVQPKVKVEELPDVYGDPKLLRQVWVNLIGNAVKYRKKEEDPYLEIGSEQDEDKDHTVYYVQDNGVGFNMKYADKLFGVFQRLHSDEEFEGTGIGLALVRRIVRRHGGNVWADSEADKGSIFYFSLPNRQTQLTD